MLSCCNHAMSIRVNIHDSALRQRIGSLIDLLGLETLPDEAAAGPGDVIVTDTAAAHHVGAAALIRLGLDVVIPGEEELLAGLLSGAGRAHPQFGLVVTVGQTALQASLVADYLSQCCAEVVRANLSDTVGPERAAVSASPDRLVTVDWNRVDLAAPTALGHLPSGAISVVASRASVPPPLTDRQFWRWVAELRRKRPVLVDAGTVSPADCGALGEAIETGGGQVVYAAQDWAGSTSTAAQLIRLADAGVGDLHVLTGFSARLRGHLGAGWPRVRTVSVGGKRPCMRFYFSRRHLVRTVGEYLRGEVRGRLGIGEVDSGAGGVVGDE